MNRRASFFGKINNLPNRITLARMGSIPLLISLYPLGFHATDIVCALVFLVAALTDFFDGYLARRMKLESAFGAAFDQIADKVLVLTAVVLLVNSQVLYSFMAILIVGRDILINGLRLLAAEQGGRIAVNALGKLKTVAISGGIFCLFLNRSYFDIDFRPIGYGLLWLGILLSIYSGYLYVQEYLEKYKNHVPSPNPDLS